MKEGFKILSFGLKGWPASVPKTDQVLSRLFLNQSRDCSDFIYDIYLYRVLQEI